MTAFDNRETAFENKYAHDEELRFKVTNRRNKLLGLWAAGELGKADADGYAKEVVLSDFEAPGDDDVLNKVLGDLKAANIQTSAEQVRAKMNELLPEAKKQIMEAA
jgi:hypothetical protein